MQVQKNKKEFYVINFFGLLFVIVPLLNFFISIKLLGFEKWYDYKLWSMWAVKTSDYDIIWQMLIAFSGLMILLRHKWSWFLSIIFLALITIKSSYFILAVENAHPINYVFVFSSLAVIMLLFYFRYPYLDRRESLFGYLKKRYLIDKEVIFSLQNQKNNGSLQDISSSSFYLKFSENDKLNLEDSGVLFLNNDFELPFQVIRKDENGFAGEFDFSDKQQKKKIKKWIKENKIEGNEIPTKSEFHTQNI